MTDSGISTEFQVEGGLLGKETKREKQPILGRLRVFPTAANFTTTIFLFAEPATTNGAAVQKKRLLEDSRNGFCSSMNARHPLILPDVSTNQ